MRTASLLTILMMIPILFASTTLASPPTNGSTILVSDSQTWEGGNLNGDVVIADGGVLTWTGESQISTDSTITIQEGGILNLNNAVLTGQASVSTLLIFDTTNVAINESIADTTATMTIYFDINVPQEAYLNLTIDEITTNEITGTSFETTVDLTDEFLIGVDHYYPLPFGITHIEIFHSNAELLTISAEDFSQRNGSLSWNQPSFHILNYGTVLLDGSTLMGANISCEHLCHFNDSTLIGSGPIHVADGTHIGVNNSVILGSRTDEDIIVHDQATIDYEESTGTGGYTDAWIRLLSKREIHVNAKVATVVATGIGYNGNTINTIINGDTDQSTWFVDIGTSESKRIVEWVDGTGTYHQETGTIKITVESNWGNFIADAVAPKTATSNVDVTYPSLSIDKIVPDAVTADTGKTHYVMVTISNTGTIPANPNVRCYTNGEEADTTANTGNWEVAPGESKDVPVSWWHYTDEATTLNCKFLYPDVLEAVSDLIADEAGQTSSEVSWTTAEEVEELPIVLYGIIIAIVVGLGVFVALGSRRLQKKEYIESEEEHDEEDDEESVDEDSTDSSEEFEEEELEDHTWTDADGNPIVSVKEE
ncbi:MAG: hypothetical protein ISR25_07995 [Candidatus Poseidoniaceae archaeon]|nr:hypothetical protein [Candidatus Poseidoniaceae archaeon]